MREEETVTNVELWMIIADVKFPVIPANAGIHALGSRFHSPDSVSGTEWQEDSTEWQKEQGKEHYCYFLCHSRENGNPDLIASKKTILIIPTL